MATPWENVERLTDEITDQTNDIFDQLKEIAQDTLSAATSPIGAFLGNINTDIQEPEPPLLEPDLVNILGKIDTLRGIFMQRPTYPTFGYIPPTLGALDTNPPGLTQINMPTAPSLVMPQFTATLDAADLEVTVPDIDWEFEEIAYVSQLKDALYNVLLNDVANGDYGINSTDEQRIWDRAREREQRGIKGSIDSATKMFTASGHTIPTGAAFKVVERIKQESREKVSSMNRELAIARGELYSKMKIHTDTTALGMEQLLMGFHGSKMDRALKAASEKVTAVVAIASFDLKRIELFVERYKALAMVFETQAKVEMVKSDIYGKQIDAVKAEVEINKLQLEEFLARNKAVIDVFLAEVEEYKARIDGYVKYIGALADTYRADAQAYAAAVDGYGKSFDLHAQYNRGDAEYKASLLNARVQRAKMVLDRAVAAAQIELEGEKATAQNAAMIATGALSGLHVSAAMGTNAQVQQSGSASTNYNYAYNGGRV